jgi:IS30 family transposase
LNQDTQWHKIVTMRKASKLSGSERSELQILHTKGYSARSIAKVLGRSPNTIADELSRNAGSDGIYLAAKASHKAYVRRKYAKYQGKKIEGYTALRTYVIDGLKAGWNPDEISGAMKQSSQPFYASKTAIYEWLYSAYGQPYCQYLPSRQYRPKKRKSKVTERVMIPDRAPLEQRPLGATNRSRYGHWEGDTVVSGKRSGGRAALAVTQERVTRLIGARLIPDLRPVSFTGAVTVILASKKALSLTLDNGIENKRHRDITAATGAKAFFCDPYSSWQKGSVEHANKLLRRYFPKGCDLGQFDQVFVDAACDRLNKKPRKILGYKSALQLAVEKGVIHRVS